MGRHSHTAQQQRLATSRAAGPRPVRAKPVRRCYNCKLLGHLARYCLQLVPHKQLVGHLKNSGGIYVECPIDGVQWRALVTSRLSGLMFYPAQDEGSAEAGLIQTLC